MTISNVTIHNIFTEGKLKAVASVVIDDCLMLNDIKVIQGTDRLFVGMPSRKNVDGGFADMVHAIHNKARDCIEAPVLNAYENYLAQEYSKEIVE